MEATVAVAPDGGGQPQVRRLRAALGTLVAIEATNDSVPAAHAAVEEAFAAVVDIQHRLHPRAPRSDLANISAAPANTPVAVSAPTWELLALARQLNTLTDGVFEPCLPSRPGTLRDVELIAGQRVLCHAPVALDFGGFAKGHAVDCAIAVLIRHGCRAGLVNAGGDLCAFGPGGQPILLRRPDGHFDAFELANAALAVSDADSKVRPAEHQGYYNRRCPDQGLRVRYAAVVADRAVVADALAKCVLLCPSATAERALRAFGAFRPAIR